MTDRFKVGTRIREGLYVESQRGSALVLTNRIRFACQFTEDRATEVLEICAKRHPMYNWAIIKGGKIWKRQQRISGT